MYRTQTPTRTAWTWPGDQAEACDDELEPVDEVLARLFHHDVLLEQGGHIRFASELMRRWVARRG